MWIRKIWGLKTLGQFYSRSIFSNRIEGIGLLRLVRKINEGAETAAFTPGYFESQEQS